MKDYWRPNSSKIPKELDVYKTLKTAGVRNVATAIGGGDIPGQYTVTRESFDLEKVPLERVHCRLVFEQLARPLEAYRSSSDMIVVLFDALQGEHIGDSASKVYEFCPHKANEKFSVLQFYEIVPADN
ncbi:hypothetical protein BC835DRAFT_1509144 [Cytidiella melzeri]|nr:hypothetical protein BC835DRAFT_1509144 [Cytidiella melzeri]